MRQINNKTSCCINRFYELTNKHLTNIKDNQTKRIELCHVAKSLMLLDDNSFIYKLSEAPDFLIEYQNAHIGLEHQLVVDNITREKEGHFETIIKRVEKELQEEKGLPNFLINCYIFPYTTYKLHEKQKVVSIVKDVIKTYILTQKLITNPYVEEIFMQKHSLKSISINEAWVQQYITPEIIYAAIKKKENKIEEYKKNFNLPQWLLLVIGGVGESSYIFNEEEVLPNISIETKFDKIFVLEDLYNTLYEIK